MPATRSPRRDLTNIPLLRHVAAIGKPMVISTGAAQIEDVRRAYEIVTAINPEVAFLQCTASYPPEWDQIDLRVIETSARRCPTR